MSNGVQLAVLRIENNNNKDTQFMLGHVPVLAAAVALATSGFDAAAATAMPSLSGAAAALYRETHGEYLWLHRGKPNAHAREALAILAEASTHGLRAGDYWLDELRILDESLVRDTSDFRLEYEGLMTDALLRLFRDLRPQLAGSRSNEHAAGADLSLLLLDAVASGRLREFYESLLPQHRQYADLRTALAAIEHESRTAGAGSLLLGSGATLRRGDTGERIAALRARLLGEVSADSAALFDADLEAAVSAYQALHGLVPDGIVGRNTQRHIDLTAADRAARVRLALARWRELPVGLGDDYVHVNIPEYRLEMYREGSLHLQMRVVVGSKKDPTPAFSDEIEYLVFNPYWHVPRSIALEELLPQAQESPGYLTRNDYEVLSDGNVVAETSIDWAAMNRDTFDFRVRQRPGKSNALGTVKFLFPNTQNIYLHDSPARHLYEKTPRAFSHGCIRVEDPQALALALLERQGGWDSDRIAATIGAGERRQVNLKQSVPVYLTYITAKVTDAGELAIFDDVYGRDEAALKRYL